DLLFTRDCVDHGCMELVPYQHLAAIFGRKARHEAFAMLKRALGQITGNARVERPVASICHDINARLFHGRIYSPSVFASEAKQSRAGRRFWIPSSLTLLAMTILVAADARLQPLISAAQLRLDRGPVLLLHRLRMPVAIGHRVGASDPEGADVRTVGALA